MLRLYDYELSGNCYKVRLLLAWLGLPWQRIAVDFHPGLAHRTPQFLAEINPRGELPVLEDGELRLADAQAILVYLASRHDPGGPWYPADALVRARIQQAFALADELTRTLARARLHLVLGRPADLAACQQAGRQVLRELDDRLAEQQFAGRPWLAGTLQPSLADIACVPYAALAGEADVDLHPYPALRAWIAALRHCEGFVAMPGVLAPGL